jgi:hypothetical protein
MKDARASRGAAPTSLPAAARRARPRLARAPVRGACGRRAPDRRGPGTGEATPKHAPAGPFTRHGGLARPFPHDLPPDPVVHSEDEGGLGMRGNRHGSRAERRLSA